MTSQPINNLGELIKMKDFDVVTFASTSAALKAERVMKESGRMFVIIPTPREISTSCGLSLKVAPGDLEDACMILKTSEVGIENVFQLRMEGNIRSVTQLNKP